MKRRVAVTLMLMFVLLGAGMAYAGSPWGEYKGFTRVNVVLNNSEVATGEVPGFRIDGRVVLPLRELSNALQALVRWDDETQTVSLFKPNVHMFVSRSLGSDDTIKQPFGKVNRGDQLDFVVFAQVDRLETPIEAFRIELVHPDGSVIRSSRAETLDQHQSSFWYPYPFKDVTFDTAGIYKVRFLMKLNAEESYTVVSEKGITAQ